MASEQLTAYTAEIEAWHDSMERTLRCDDGWLTLAGLYWLHEGTNTIGSDPASDILLPDSSPAYLGAIEFDGTKAVLKTISVEPVSIDEVPIINAELRDDTADDGPSLVRVGAITFFVIHRGDKYGIRVRDQNSEVRRSFTGRKWFPVDPAYRILATFHPYEQPRTYSIINILNMVEKMDSPGEVTFEIAGQALRMIALDDGDDKLWFVFKDATSGDSTYGAGRFLKVPLPANGTTVDLDFNRAYNPPCAFTAYATCPLPPPENVLPVKIAAGEQI
jgi:uncharacterized protein (DUF1684 family)